MSFLAWAVFGAWSFAAFACAIAFLLLWIVGTDPGVSSPDADAQHKRLKRIDSVLWILAQAFVCAGFAFSLERVAALWPW